MPKKKRKTSVYPRVDCEEGVYFIPPTPHDEKPWSIKKGCKWFQNALEVAANQKRGSAIHGNTGKYEQLDALESVSRRLWIWVARLCRNESLDIETKTLQRLADLQDSAPDLLKEVAGMALFAEQEMDGAYDQEDD